MKQNSFFRVLSPGLQRLLPFVICILGSSFYVFDYFLAVSPSIMTADLLHTFSLSAGKLGMLLALFFLASTFFQIPAGMLLDRFGARKLLTLSVLVSGLGTLLFSVASHPWELGVARLLMGLGSPFAFLGALFLASRWFAHRHFALTAGLVQLGAALGCMMGGGPLAILVNHFGWRSTLFWMGWITLLLSLVFWFVIRDTPLSQPQHSEKQPSLPFLKILKQRQIIWISLLGFISWVPVTGIASLWGLPYLMEVYGWTNEQAGYVYTLFWLGLGLGSPCVGLLSDRLKSRKLPFYVCLSLGFLACLLYVDAPHLPVWLIYMVLLVLGFSASLQSLTFALAKDIVPHRHFVAVSGLINLAAVLTGVVLQPLMGFMIDLSFACPLFHYQAAFLLLAGFFIVGLLLTRFSLKETHCRTLY